MYCVKKPLGLFSFPRSLFFILLATCASVSASTDLPSERESSNSTESGGSWEGLYFGAKWGYGFGSTKWRDPHGYYSISPTDVPADGYNDGLLGGIQIGFNKQYGSTVIGIEGDVNAGRLIGHAPCGATAGVGGSGDTCGNQTDMIASLTGRLGFTAGSSLFYVKGGGAYSRDRTTVSNYYSYPITPASSSSGRYGWTVGAGYSYAIDSNWFVNAEYVYYDYGKHTYESGTGGNSGSFSVSHVQQVASIGLNYRLRGEGGNSTSLAISDELSGEFGARVGYSNGRFQKKLYSGLNHKQLNSILTWPNQDGPILEAFARIDHSTGWFLKGTLGAVNIGSGKMNDEDTVAAMSPEPYSNTVSSTKNGRNFYGTLDLGLYFLREESKTFGGFIGYGYYSQHLNAYGCEQVAGSVVCAPAGSINPSALALSETEKWNALRLGLTGNVMLTDRLNLSGEIAWLPYASLSAKDNHWFRSDINPMDEKGHGSKGYQLESTLSYAVNRQWRVGGGVRYLYLQAEGSTQFPFPGYPRSPEYFESSRFNAYCQASYSFGN